MAIINNKYPMHTEIKIDDVLLTKISLDQKNAQDYQVILHLDGYEKYSKWYEDSKIFKDAMIKSGGYDSSSISIVEKGEIKVSFNKNSDVKEFVEYIASGDVFGVELTVRDKNILLDALKMDAEVPHSLLIEYCELLYTWKVDEILRKGIEDPDTPINKNGHHPIHIAYLKKSQYLAETLLNRGADINNLNDEGKTALGMAVEDADKQWVKYLLSKGADDSVKINGHNLLQVATECFVNADKMYNDTGLYEYYYKKNDYFSIARDLAHKHKDWINLSGESSDAPIYTAHDAHDHSLYNALLSEVNNDSSASWWWF